MRMTFLLHLLLIGALPLGCGQFSCSLDPNHSKDMFSRRVIASMFLGKSPRGLLSNVLLCGVIIVMLNILLDAKNHVANYGLCIAQVFLFTASLNMWMYVKFK